MFDLFCTINLFKNCILSIVFKNCIRALVLTVLKSYIAIFSTTKYKFMTTLIEAKSNNLAQCTATLAVNVGKRKYIIRLCVHTALY